jgi:hypothetical protein
MLKTAVVVVNQKVFKVIKAKMGTQDLEDQLDIKVLLVLKEPKDHKAIVV